MTSSGGLRLVSLPLAPRGTLRSQWLALVYPASARPRSQPETAVVPFALRAVCNRPGSRILPLRSVLVRFATIGSVSQTR